VQNDNPLVQVGTAYNQVDLTQKILFQPNKRLSFLANIQYSNSSNVPRYDQLTQSTVTEIDGNRIEDFRFSEWYYGPQKRFLSALTTEYTPKDNKAFDRLAIILAYQHIEEDRISRRFGRILRTNQEEDVHVGSLNVDFSKSFKKSISTFETQEKQRLLYGLEINYNAVKSLAYNEDIETGALDFNAVTRYPDGGSEMTMAAAYVGFRQKISEKYTIDAGLRYTFTSLQSKYADTTRIQLPYTEIASDLGALTGSLAMIWKIAQNTNINAIASTAFRSPNVDDFGKIRAKGDFVTIPNPNLSSEYALNGELSITQYFKLNSQKQNSTASLTGFYTYLFDAIVRDFTTLNGTDSLLHFGDYYTTQWNTNAGTAFIYGLSANVDLVFGEYWNLKSSLNYIKGWNTFDDAPLAHIPPIYGQTSLNYTRERFRFRFLTRYNGWKKAEEFDLAGTDNLEFATADGSPSWLTLNAYATYQVTTRIMMTLAVENILDTHYRPFSSGVSASGRNVVLSLRTNF
jgi:hemoglobin/transferrin/lactoferrin receptor protein